MAIKRALLILIVMAASSSVYAADQTVNLLVGRSTVIDTGSPIQRVSLTSSDVADALVTSPAQLLIHGKTPGSISMFVWDRGGAIRRYDVTVQRDLSRLTTQIQELFPAEHITVQSTGRSVAVSGTVSTKLVAEKAVDLVAGFMEKKEDVVNLLQVQEAGASDQVLLQVRFAEVTRNALTQLGSSFFTGAAGYQNIMARTTTGQDAAPTFDNSGSTPKLVFSDFLNLFLFDTKHQLGTVITALQTKGQFQSLAEPNLVAESGKEASFLAGGEFPVPIAQGSSSGNVAISVQYKEYGVRLSFTPIIRGDRVHLKVKPEVSTLDFANGVTLQGFRIPALTTRRTETELELADGQTFAIAGLINNQMNSTLRKIPGIGDIPILGLLFQSKVAEKDQTELVVMITPHILPKISPGVTAELPRTPDSFLAPLPVKKSVEPLPPAFSTPRAGGAGATLDVPVAPAGTPAPSVAPAVAAAAAVSALTPKGPTMVQPKEAAASKKEAIALKKASASNVAPTVNPADLKVLEKARREEERASHEQVKHDASTARQAANQAGIQRLKDEQETKRQEHLAREQAKRDAEASAKAALVAAHQAEADKRIAARQAEADKKQQKVIDEASARLKAAEANYQSEIAKKDKS
jgi:pilus assembly protein CpaC